MVIGKKRSALIKLFVLFIVVSIILIVSCDGETVPTEPNYNTFEIQPDDIRFRFFQHPVYRFEYPSVFELIDMNTFPEPQLYEDKTIVEFTVRQLDLPKPQLTITVEKPNEDYQDAHGKLGKWLSGSSHSFEKILTETTNVNGIPAEYVYIFLVYPKFASYPEHNVTIRSVFFDYGDNIWFISLDWSFLGDEPPEVEGYFQHVIDTFKILD